MALFRQQIASLYADIGADTSGLKAGLTETKNLVKGTGRDLVSLGATAKSAFTQLATASFIATVALGALKKGYEGARAGAFLEADAERFERLAATVQSTSDSLLVDLKAATQGTRSEMELMATASSVLGLGLVDTREQAIRLARVMGALNQDVNELTLALANQTTRRFDQLNVSTRGFQERLDGLRDSGLDVNAAFTEAFLQQAEQQIQTVGDVADTAAGSFLRLEARIKDANDQFKRASGEGLAPFIERILDVQDGADLARRALDDGVITIREYNQGVDQTNIGLFAHQELLDLIAQRYAEARAELEAITAATESFDRAMLNSAGLENATESAFNLKQELSDLRTLVEGPLVAAFEGFGAQQLGLFEQAAQIRDAMAMLEGRPVTAEGRAELLALQAEMRNVQAEILNTSAAFDDQTLRVIYDMLLQRVAIADIPESMRSAAFQMVYDMGLAWGLIDQVTFEGLSRIDHALLTFSQGNVQQAQRELQELGMWAQSVAGDYFIRFHVTTDQLSPLQQQYAGDFVNQNNINQGVNEAFPPGTFTPPGGLGGGGGGGFAPPELPNIKPPKIKETLAQQLSPYLEAARAVSQIGDMFAETLQKQIDAYKRLASAGHIDAVIRMEKERLGIAGDMAMAQEKLLALQKAQQQLALLEQQIRLMNLIQEHQLDAAGILEGLELGIDANASDVVEAMTRALNELIQQMQEQLQLGSPSRLTFKYGRWLIEGLEGGVQAGLASLSNVGDLMLNAFDFGRPMGGSATRMDPGRPITINVHPSEGMDENDLARKVAELVQRQYIR